MKSAIETVELNAWDESISSATQQQAIQSLEQGSVLFFPKLSFPIKENEKKFLSPKYADPKSKNISYDISSDRLKGTTSQGEEANELKQFIKNYALQSNHLIETFFPQYIPHILQARTSFRPIEIAGRLNPSRRKDDKLLHVDSFPSSPTQGNRILRVFTNINPFNKPRVWRVGEPFAQVVQKMMPHLRSPFPGSAYFLQLLKITKGYRSLYDHYMLKMHDRMKEDSLYQESVSQQEFVFPSGSTWIVFTDQVSHAAMSGQYVLEQTFQLSVDGLYDRKTSPLFILEKYLTKRLIA